MHKPFQCFITMALLVFSALFISGYIGTGTAIICPEEIKQLLGELIEEKFPAVLVDVTYCYDLGDEPYYYHGYQEGQERGYSAANNAVITSSAGNQYLSMVYLRASRDLAYVDDHSGVLTYLKQAKQFIDFVESQPIYQEKIKNIEKPSRHIGFGRGANITEVVIESPSPDGLPGLLFMGKDNTIYVLDNPRNAPIYRDYLGGQVHFSEEENDWIADLDVQTIPLEAPLFAPESIPEKVVLKGDPLMEYKVKKVDIKEQGAQNREIKVQQDQKKKYSLIIGFGSIIILGVLFLVMISIIKKRK